MSTLHHKEEQIEQSYEYQKEEDLEVSQATQASATVSNVIWPPPLEDYRLTPTATPLYIPPPETQHVKPKYIEKVEHRESRQTEQQQSTHQETREQTKTTISAEERREMQQHEMQVYQQQQYEQQQYQQQQAMQWQSRSAPELTVGKQQVDVESSSDSYTSTCTTTTTTSEEYQKMYQAQVQAYQMQQMYEQSGSEMDYHMDMEVAAMQQQQEQSYSASSEFLSAHSGRRSAQECAETIRGPVSTYKLIDLVREVTPSPTPPSGKGPRKVEFKEDIEQKEESVEMIEKTEAKTQKKEVKIKEEKDEEISEAVFEKVEIERKFPPAPEIKIEIPEPKPVPPSNIPNSVPKEWISPMQKALTTAPDKPVVLSDICPSCPCEKPCKAAECKCKKEAEKHEEKRKEEKGQKVSKEEIVEEKPEVLTETPPKGSFIARVVSTAPTDPVQFAPKSSEPIPLPEETEPYMPPPIDMKPYIREDFRPKSPMLRALTTAPEEPFSPLGEGVASQLDDLPRPKGKLTMVDALTVASDRSYSPLNPENILSFTEKKEDKKMSSCKRESLKEQTIQKSVDVSVGVDQAQASSAFASFSGQSSISSFQPRLEPITYIPGQSSVQTTSISGQAQDAHYTSYSSHSSSIAQKQQHQQSMFQTSSSFQSTQQSQTHVSSTSQVQQTTSAKSECHKQTTCAKSECHKKQHTQEKTQVVSFPPEPGMPAKKAVLSGLHKPETIPQYQRNWTVLPSQRPVRTPEPPELKENVPLAFVDVSREQSPNIEKPQAVKTPASYSTSAPSSAGAAVSNATRSSETKPKMQPPTVPIIIEDRSGPITMTFQSIDDQAEQHNEDHSYAHPRPFTPSIINRAPPIVPFYQTPENLVFEECAATTSHPFDRRSVSPLPERAKSPAPGPPPNPLNAIRAPRIKEDDLVPARVPQLGSITTGQPYLGGHLMQQHQQQGQVLSHYQTVSQAGSQSFVDKPEVVQQSRIGDMQVEKREKESHLSEEQQSKLESKTTTQIGNTQIERRRKVVEEFEHTQKAKTVEIRQSSGGTIQQTHQYGKTGFVANQTSRLSGLEKEISSLTSQAQAISARAATLGQSESTKFPQFQSPEPISKFPISSPLHSYGEPEKQESLISGNSVHQYAAQETQSAAVTSSSSYAASSLSQSSASHSFLGSSNISAGSASNYASAIPVPAFKPPLFSAGGDGAATDKSAATSSNNTYKPTPSTGPAGFKPPPPVQPSNINPSSNVSDPSPASTGGAGPGAGKGAAFGATSAPKRGRGILNKAVGPGARVPLCGCCNAQVRGPFITALGRIWCPEHFVCVNANCRRPLQDIGFVEEKGDLYCEYCFEKYLAPSCSKCNAKIKGDCLNAIGKHFHPECFTCSYCGKLFGNSPFFLEEGEPYCEADWNELFTTKCFACGFPVEAGDRWVEALNHNYHSQCFNCTMCKKNLEGQSFYNKGGRPFCKNHAR